MARKVRGSDCVSGEAAGWSPAPKGQARALRVEAAALTKAAIETRDPVLASRALAVRSEARVSAMVASYHPPSLDPSGPMPFGPARGGLVRVLIPDVSIDPTTGADKVTEQAVRKRRGKSALSGLPGRLRSVAEAYADLVAAVGSPGGPGMDAPRGGGLSDGGAAARCALAAQLRDVQEAIGCGAVIRPRNRAAHADRSRVTITERGLVDRVCIHGHTVSQVLAAHGWSRRAAYERALRQALEAALRRMASAV